MSVYLDANVIVPTLVFELRSADVEQFFLGVQESFTISEFAAAEVSSAFSRLVRMGKIDVERANLGLTDFDAWRAANAESIGIGQADLRLASAFVRRFDLGLRAPDALHVALCRRAGLGLATLDRRLARAAEALGVRTAAIIG